MSDIFTVLSDPTRRALLQALAVGPRTVSDLVALTSEGQPTVSKHLKTLRDAGLVTAQAAGQARVYSIDRGPLAEIEAFLAEVAPGMGGTGAGASGSKTPANDVEKVLTDAAVALSGWITDGANWLGSKVQEKVADANIDPQAVGRDVGRKLADAKLQATDTAADAQAALRAELGDLSSRLGVSAAELRATVEDLVEESKKTAAGKYQEVKDSVFGKAKAQPNTATSAESDSDQ
ncbi:MAG: winged helix-turn-helix transcriptional regulator [Actinomycetales bacterium]|nr:winged helix-turn-helix transcriptional regulator [Actinomycetales bacterium]